MTGFSVFLRKSRSPYYQVKFTNELGQIVATRSTGETKHNKAIVKAAEMARIGEIGHQGPGRKPTATTLAAAFSFDQIIKQLQAVEITPDQAKRIVQVLNNRGLLIEAQSNRDFGQYLLEFWDYKNSPYVKEKLTAGQKIGERHCHDKLLHVKRWYLPYFQNKLIGEITRQDIKAFLLYLSDKVHHNTVTKILLTGTVALKFAFENDLISMDPTVGIKKPTAPAEKRGLLTNNEVQKLFSIEWLDKRAMIGNWLASATGMRSGEILALQVTDIGLDRIFVNHSFCNVTHALKPPKNGESRQVPLLPEIRLSLLELAAENPHGENFVFWGTTAGKPMEQKILLNGLYNAMENIGIDAEERKTRNILFHSWRHYYSSKLADIVDSRSLQLSTGHKTAETLAHYSNHANEGHFDKVAQAASKAFGNVIPFKAAN